MRRPGPGLLIVLAGAAAGQLVALTQRPLAVMIPSSAAYVFSAEAARTRLDVLSAERPPVYGIFMASVQMAGGFYHPGLVVVAQAALVVATALAVYAAVLVAGGGRVAGAAGALAGLAPPALAWERVIAPEALLAFELAATGLLLLVWLRTRRAPALALMAGVAALAGLTEPALAYLPAAAILLAAIPAWRHWRAIVLAGAAASVLFGAYVIVDDHRYPGAGLGEIANQQLYERVALDGLQPAELEADPDRVGAYFATAASLSRAAIAAQPARYVSLTVQEAMADGPWAALLALAVLWVLVAAARRDAREYATVSLLCLAAALLLVSAGTTTSDAAMLRAAAAPLALGGCALVFSAPLRWLAGRSGGARVSASPPPLVQPGFSGLP